MSAEGPDPGVPAKEIFPTLTPAQIERIAPLGRERPFEAGEILFEAGGLNRPLMVVLEGEIEILSERDTVVTVHRPGNFSGDVDVIAGHPAVVRARGRSAGRVLEVPAQRVRSLVVTDPELSQIFLRAFILRRTLLMSRSAGSIVLIGSRHSAGTLTLQEFLTRNNQPYTYLDADQDAGVQGTLEGFGMGVDDVPVLICSGSRVLKKPTIEQVADCLGLSQLSRDVVRDLVVIGAGPAGLAAAVYGASEGLDVLVLEATAPGGQAGASSRIENYLGFPTGVSGQDLANSALLQAQKFGAELVVARTAAALRCDRKPYRIGLGPGVDVAARTVVIATGATYRKPDIPNLARFEGVGVYYGATQVEELLCRGDDVVVVGGANSAGQAAIFLSEGRRRVTMLIRGPALSDTMSRYLIRRIEETPNIELKTQTRIVAPRRHDRSRARDVGGRGGQGHDGPHAPRLHDDRGEPEHRMAAELHRARREGLREGGTGSLAVRSRGVRVAPAPPAPSLRNEPARRLRRRRRARGQRQARGRRGGRRLRLHPARAQGAGGVNVVRLPFRR